MNVQNPRQIAARVLSQRLNSGEFTENLLETALAMARFSPADRGLCHELVCGVVRWQATLDCLIARKTTPGREQRPALQNLLRLGLYQIFWLDRIPPHAAVHETVELAKRAGYHTQAGFINAVLRAYLRETDEIRKILADMKISQPALGWSHPEWLVEKWRKNFGDEKTRQLLEWNNTPPKTFARINMLKTDAAKLIERWREEKVEHDLIARDWTGENLAFELKAHPPLHTLGSFRDGWFYVQDPSTLLAPSVMAAQPGEVILDLCAAPGGKTTFVAQVMNNEGKIVACDLDAVRLKLVKENCTRLGVTNVETAIVATANLQPASFDRILIDAPCSNTGVMRRRVDLRWRIQSAEIERLRRTQLELLGKAAPLLKPGGLLVYSTCSLEPEENSDVVKQFLAANGQFKLEAERQLLPFDDGVDGAYVAKLRRVE
ncbi:MAG TPA: 16S rRNA (cytosine(967)-C(5))-methyltransferase RsmB [Verrucomicrobiae bacterium]|nr:16S rRNA (cytosine(967)-C(5))-methyltransferase RsmB [Verrucomicrobiae bacterium]